MNVAAVVSVSVEPDKRWLAHSVYSFCLFIEERGYLPYSR